MFIVKRSAFKKSLAALLAGGIALTLLPSESEAGKTITRSCNAYYEAVYKKINGIPTSGLDGLSGFSATRHCGSSVPNRCRERAREAIFTCGTVHYAQRWTRNTIPSHCTLVEGVKNYTVRDIKDEIERGVCCRADQTHHKNVEVELWLRSRGDKGCGSGSGVKAFEDRRRISGTYAVDCVDARKRLCN